MVGTASGRWHHDYTSLEGCGPRVSLWYVPRRPPVSSSSGLYPERERGGGERGGGHSAREPGPTQLAKGYASLFQKTLRKGLFSSFLYVLDIGKGVLFLKIVSSLEKRVSI